MDSDTIGKLIGLAFAVVLVIALAMCAPRTDDGREIRDGYPVLIKVRDGREYECIRIPAGHSSAFIDCKQVRE